jgi:hypothetical protein
MRTITKLFEGLRSINQIAYILIADVPHKTNWTCMAHVPQGVASLGGLEDLVRGSSDINRGHKRKLKKERSSTKCLEANRTSRLLSRPSDIKVASVDRHEFELAVNCTFVHGPPASDSSKKETCKWSCREWRKPSKSVEITVYNHVSHFDCPSRQTWCYVIASEEGCQCSWAPAGPCYLVPKRVVLSMTADTKV